MTTTGVDPGNRPGVAPGSWSAQVGRPGGTSAVIFHFTPDERVFILSGGAGRWTPTGPDRFSFTVAEAMFGEDGGFAGWVHIEQDAVCCGSTFTSSGTSVVHDATGAEAYRTEVKIVARLAAAA